MRKTNRYLIALVAALGLIPIVLDTTIVTVVLTPIRIALSADVNTAQWIITGYILANAAIVAVGGYLASRFGRKRMFVIGIALFTMGSVLCGISPNINWLIAFRVLQGIGGGLLLPVGPAIAFDAFPKEERARASGVVGVPVLLAPVFGPILGGYLNDTFGWHSIFFVNLPVGIAAIAVALAVLPRDTAGEERARRFDYVGLTLSILGVIAIIYAITLVTQTNPSTVTATNPNGDLYGWGYWSVWVWIGAGAALLGAFAVYSLFISRDPALDLRQLKRRDFLVSNLVSWTAILITYGLLVLLPIYFEAVRLPHLSAQDTGLAMVPLGIGTIAGTIFASGLYRAIGPRLVALCGVAASAASAWLLAHTIQSTANASQLLASAQTHAAVPSVAGPDELRWLLLLVGFGFAILGITVQTLALEALTGEALAKASSLVISTKFIFSSVGVAIITSIFEAQTRSRATDLANQMLAQSGGTGSSPSNPAVVAALHAVQAQIGTQAGAWAIQSIFWLIFYGSFALLLLALIMPGRRRQMGEAQAEGQEPMGTPAASGALPREGVMPQV
jgi:DHA2 family multidrug resistance protein